MVDPSILADKASQIFSGWGTKLMFYMGYAIVIIIVLAAVYVAFQYFTHNIKAEVYKLYGSGQDGVFSFAKPRGNRVKWIKKRTAWKPLFPLMNRIEIEPFDSEYIYPGNIIKVFDLNGIWIPGRININKSESQIRSEINPAPYSVRSWQSLQHKKNAMEFAKTDWWSENKTLMICLIAGIAILIAACVTVWLTYKLAGAGSSDISALTQAIKGFGNIPGQSPPGG